MVLTSKLNYVDAAHYFLNWLQSVQSSSVAQSCPTLRPHEPQHARPPCPSPTPRVHPNPCPLSQWCHPTISSSVVPFSFCPQSFPASGSFQMSQPFTLIAINLPKYRILLLFVQNIFDILHYREICFLIHEPKRMVSRADSLLSLFPR